MYPGGAYDGSAVYHRSLNAALRARGVEISVACTRSSHLQHVLPFFLRWPNELSRRTSDAGIPVRRFRSVNVDPIGPALSGLVMRRWSREDTRGGEVLSGSSQYVRAAVQRAINRPARYSAYADIGRGPLSPGLIGHIARVASRFDAIMVGYAPFSLARQVLFVAQLTSTPVAVLPFLHDTDRYHHFASLYDVYRRASVVLTLSGHTTKFLNEHVPECHAATLGAGVTLSADEPNPTDIAQFRRRHHLYNRRILLFVGRKEPGKRYEMAVDAVNRLDDDAVLVMVGGDHDGKEISSARVRYLGTVSDRELAVAYASCDVFVFPSEHESLGMVFLDAWKHGKPVVGNARCGAAATLIDDGVDGYLCRDATAIAAAARRLLSDSALADTLGSAGREKVLTEYTWAHVADRTIDALSAAIARRSVPRSRNR